MHLLLPSRLASFPMSAWIGAVGSIMLSIMLGYGILFTISVPFTSMTQVVPFGMFGIGLDDAFILWGAYKRLGGDIPVLDRIHMYVEEAI